MTNHDEQAREAIKYLAKQLDHSMDDTHEIKVTRILSAPADPVRYFRCLNPSYVYEVRGESIRFFDGKEWQDSHTTLRDLEDAARRSPSTDREITAEETQAILAPAEKPSLPRVSYLGHADQLWYFPAGEERGVFLETPTAVPQKATVPRRHLTSDKLSTTPSSTWANVDLDAAWSKVWDEPAPARYYRGIRNDYFRTFNGETYWYARWKKPDKQSMTIHPGCFNWSYWQSHEITEAEAHKLVLPEEGVVCTATDCYCGARKIDPANKPCESSSHPSTPTDTVAVPREVLAGYIPDPPPPPPHWNGAEGSAWEAGWSVGYDAARNAALRLVEQGGEVGK